jgi:serine/threonine protein kinase
VSAHPHGDPLIGQVVDDRYRILRVVGRGGMGVVYEAEATRLGKRLCAVKVLLPEFTRNANAVARFAREAQMAGRVKHPNVVEISDTGTTRDGLGYIAMELLRGESLDRTLRRDGALPWPRAQRIILQICRALAAAHAEGIVHRDMKPENCFRCRRDDDDDFIKVLDFGIAKLTDPEVSPDAGRLTATNSVIGTYSYMAYEQICGEEVDHRVDVWASGVILYELLTGQLPFRGNNQGQIWRAITDYDPAPMRNLAPRAGIPEALEPIVRQALARSLTDRYPSIEAFARALANVQVGGSVRAVTGKLGLPTLPPAPSAPSPTLGVAPTLAAALPRLSQQTAPVSIHGLTELMPDDAVVDTNETALAAAPGRSTQPERRTDLAPSREVMRTELAPQPVLPPPPRRGRGALRVLAFASLPAIAVAVLLSRATDETPEANAEMSAPAISPAAVDPAPESQPLPAAPAPAPSEPTPVPGEPPPALPEPAPAATKVATPPKKAPESFNARVKKVLGAYRAKVAARECPVKKELVITIKVASATGAARLTMPASLQGAGIQTCLERALQDLKFPRSPGSVDYSEPLTIKP